MKMLMLYSLIFVSIAGSKAQEKYTARYLGQAYNFTKNKSFINNELIFFKDNDTLRINVKLPYDTIQHQIIDRGIYYNCHLKKDTVYTFIIKKICVIDIPMEYNSYYHSNIIVNKKDCSSFKEIEKNTEYVYRGNYGKYIDMNNVLYEIVGLSPDSGCVFQH